MGPHNSLLMSLLHICCHLERCIKQRSWAFLACMMIIEQCVCGGVREGLVGVGIASGIIAAVGAVVLAAVFGGRRR